MRLPADGLDADVVPQMSVIAVARMLYLPQCPGPVRESLNPGQMPLIDPQGLLSVSYGTSLANACITGEKLLPQADVRCLACLSRVQCRVLILCNSQVLHTTGELLERTSRDPY